MKNNLKQNLIIISIIFFILLFFALYFFYKEIEKKDLSQKDFLVKWHTENSEREEIKTILQSIEEIEFNNKLIEEHFAKRSNFVSFLDTIDNLAQKVEGEDEIVSVEITPEKSELIVGIQVIGTFESVYKTLKLLENSSYEIQFLSVDIQKIINSNKNDTEIGIKSEKTGKIFPWEGIFKIKLLSFIP